MFIFSVKAVHTHNPKDSMYGNKIKEYAGLNFLYFNTEKCGTYLSCKIVTPNTEYHSLLFQV